MMDHPSSDEIHKTIKQINTGKAPGLDGIPIEVLLHGGGKLAAEIHCLISDVWLGAPVPKDWIDAILISLYKGKGFKSVCGDYRGISLLEAVGIPLGYPGKPKWFYIWSWYDGMIFSACQLQEKCIEHCIALY